MTADPIRDIIRRYDPTAELPYAHTIPASWYTDTRVLDAERQTVTGGSTWTWG